MVRNERVFGLQQVFPTGDVVDNTTIDVIAIHGLDARSPKTWEYRKDGKITNWISDDDMLPAAIPNARIYTYDWNANCFQDAPVETLFGHAKNLLSSAATKKGPRERPIIFVASCFGGLVLIDAICQAACEGNPYRHVLMSTVGIVFLATPFHGTNAASSAKWLVTVNGIRGKGSSDMLIKDLQNNDRNIFQRVQTFTGIANTDTVRLPIYCFYETQPTRLLRKVISAGIVDKFNPFFKGYILVDASSAYLGGSHHQGLDAAHSLMNKFKDSQCDNFARVKAALQKLVDGAQSILDRRNGSQPSTNAITATSLPANTPTGTTSKLYFIVPFNRNENFTGREEILDQLLKRIDPREIKTHCQRTIVQGLGGIGKTQVVLEAAYRIRDKCSIFWVPAVDITTFENAYREIGQKLQLPGIEDSNADIKRLIKTALSEGSTGEWLLIIDNLDDHKLLEDFSSYLPTNPHKKGSILFTTRTHAIVENLDIPQTGRFIMPEMSRAEAKELLTKLLRDDQIGNTIDALLDFLADLPLAIKQASAYMSETGISTDKYFNYCQETGSILESLLSKDFSDAGRYKDGQKNAVAKTWLISFDLISQQSPLASNFLKTLCYMGKEDIPTSLLPQEDDALEREEAIGILKAYAFITERPGSSSYDMHRLVRLATQTWIKQQEEHVKWIRRTATSISNAFPDVPNWDNQNMWIKYIPHAEALLQFQEFLKDDLYYGKILYSLGVIYDRLGKYTDAEMMGQSALQLHKTVLGPDNRTTITSMYSFALTLEHRNKLAQAEILTREILQLTPDILGPDELVRLNSMSTLGAILVKQGKYDEGERILRRTLQLYEEVRGREEIDTITCIHELGWASMKQGKIDEAEILYRQAIQLQEKTIGPEHPWTLATLSNLGYVFTCKRQYKEAVKIYERTLELQRKVLGEEHPSTLISKEHLDDTRGKWMKLRCPSDESELS